MDLQKIKLDDIDLRKMGMLNAFALISVLVAVAGLVFGVLLTFAGGQSVTPNRARTGLVSRRETVVDVKSPGAKKKVKRSLGIGTATKEIPQTLGKIAAIPTTTDLLGEWYLNRRAIGGHIRIYEDSKRKLLFVDWTYRDGKREFRTAKRSADKILLDLGSYCVINADGDLEHRTTESELIWTAKKH